MNYCCVAYTFYETDHRVKRYAELYTGSKNTVHAIALRPMDSSGNHAFINGVKLFYASNRDLEEKGRFGYLFKILKFFFRGAFLLTLNQIRYRYAVIHLHNVPDFLVFMAIIPKLFGAKLILDIHDVMPELYCEKFGKSFDSLLAKTLLFLEKISIKFVDYTIVANDLWLAKVRNRTTVSQNQSCSLLNYPNITIFSATTDTKSAVLSKPQSLALIYPGHISYHHGIDIAVRAFALVHQELPDATFTLYARTFIISYREQLETLIRELKLEQRVTINKCLAPREIAEKMRNSHIGIVPKRGSFFAAEAFSTKILEFFAVGTPVIASRTAIDEYYFDDSLVEFFDDGSHEDCARKIIGLFKDTQRQQTLAANGIQFIQHNNWQCKSALYTDIISSLLKSRKNNGADIPLTET
ncbi:MAG: glycosyltransferase family 4 protein [Chitinivibrionales bacterium]|nr:glycosyltransferase family 4 protein [Chitinivibrionales bacterium]